MTDETSLKPEDAPAAIPGRIAKLRYLLLSLLVLTLDQWSKWLVEVHLPEHVAQPVIPGLLNLTRVRNTGVAFGLFASTGRGAGVWVLTGLGVVALTLVTLYFWHVPRSNRMLQSALALVLGGAVGNLMDRVAAGAVTDFIDFYAGTYHWHTFNVADSAISVGIALIVWDTLRSHRRQAEPESAAAEG